jgi:hypothetical protein
MAAADHVEEPRGIGRYQVGGVLGRGGFATVYRAWDPLLNREVALKVLLPALAGEHELRTRFLAEARMLAGMRHPGIAVVHDVGEASDQPYFAMELIEGQTLAERIAHGRTLSLEETAAIAERLCAAVDALHDAGVLHRDIKPSNIMLERSGRVVLMDFGIARMAGAELTAPGSALLGTPLVMAPEQVRGEPAGPPADIYALGVLIYQMLAGQPPFTGDVVQILHAHAYEPPPPLWAHRPGLPHAVYTIVDAALAKDPADRPRRATDLAGALAHAAGEQATLAGNDQDARHRDQTRRLSMPPLPSLGRARPARPRRAFPRGAVLTLCGAILLLALAILVTRGDLQVPEQSAGAAHEGPVGQTSPVVSGFRIYDNVFARRQLEFTVGDSVAACFSLQPGGDPLPLVVAVTNQAQPPSDLTAASVVARSEPLPNEQSETCHTVRVLPASLPAGSYWAWVLHDGVSLAEQSFVVAPKPGDIVLADNFDDPTRGILPQMSPNPAGFSVAYTDGAYTIAKLDPGFAGVPYVRLPGTYEHVSVAFDVRLVGPASDRYVTVGCRTSAPTLDDGYRFSLNVEAGTFLLDRWDGGAVTSLAQGGPSPVVRRGGQVNRIELTCSGGTIAVDVNGTRVTSARDDTHRSGLLWIGVESDPSRRHGVEARFDNLVVIQQAGD